MFSYFLCLQATDFSRCVVDSYTNTYGDVSRLADLYSRVLARPDIVGLSVGTRPDCMGDDVLAMLAHLNA